MKTMNFLFTMVFAILIGACTNETQTTEEELSSIDLKGKKSQEKEENQKEEEEGEDGPVYFEWDLHLIALSSDIMQIEEEIETFEGNPASLHLKLERKQTELEKLRNEVNKIVDEWVESGKMDYFLNRAADNEVLSQNQSNSLSEYLRRVPRLGPGRPGFPCGEESRCNLILNNATTIFVLGKKNVGFGATVNGELCGEFDELNPVDGFEGEIFLTGYQGEEGCADKLRVKGEDADGNTFSYGVQLVQ
jgi:hypothetical protein